MKLDSLRWTCSAVIAAITLSAAPASAAEENLVETTRTENADDSLAKVSYNFEVMGPYELKFETIGSGLGEDGADQTDTFKFDLDGRPGSLRVKTKADTTAAYSYLSEVGETHLDSQGFEVTLVSRSAGSITVSVRSVSNTAALSHIEFSLPDDMAAQYD